MNTDLYFQTKHSKHIANLFTDTVTIFTNLKTANALMTQKEIDKYITKITAGKSTSYLNRYRCWKHNDNGYAYGGSYILGEFLIEYLTERHLLTKLQVDKIIENINTANTLTWKWVDNLINLNYTFTPDQLQKIALKGYKISIGLIMTKQNATIEDLYALCSTSDLDLGDITKVCKKYKLIPDNTCFTTLLNNYSKATAIHIDKYLDVLLENNFKPDSTTIENAISSLYHTYHQTTIQKMINVGAIFNNTHLDTIYTQTMKKFSTNNFTILENFTALAMKNNIIPTYDNFKTIILASREYSTDILGNGTSRINLYNLFLEKLKINVTSDLCDYVCQIGDEKLFSYLVEKKLFIATENSILLACRNRSKYIIENLANMKILADKKCAINLHLDTSYYGAKSNDEIINLLVMAGMLIDYDTIDILCSKGYSFPDITTYGLEYGDEIYYTIHKNQSISQVNVKNKNEPIYLQKLNKKIVEFRKLFALSFISIDRIEKQIEKDKLEPDMFCYDNAITNEPLRNWLENKYNFKPTLISLSRIDTFTARQQIISQYFNDPSKCHMDHNMMKLYIKNNNSSKTIANDVIHDTNEDLVKKEPVKAVKVKKAEKKVCKKIKIKGKVDPQKADKN